MTTTLTQTLFLGIAAIPFIYFSLALVSSLLFFLEAPDEADKESAFLPPISNLKPVRGLDPDAFENFASFCRQDYPQYEILLCVDPEDQTVAPMVEKLRREFPERSIRVLRGSGRDATNDKVAKLARLVSEAQHEVVV